MELEHASNRRSKVSFVHSPRASNLEGEPPHLTRDSECRALDDAVHEESQPHLLGRKVARGILGLSTR